jgi:hypothetical protein
VFGPDGVLFLARWPVNEMGQQLPASSVTDKVIDLTPLGVVSSPGGLNFVPPGFGGEGDLKLVSWPGGEWYTILIEPDGSGLFDIVGVEPETTIPGGPENFVHIGPVNPGFDVESLLVADWSENRISAYESDGDGNPVPATRQLFVDGLDGAEGAYIDPLSGDFLFMTWGGDDVLIAIQGFAPPPVE